MIDIHCHILPMIDDGAASLNEALAMARFCATDGITHIFATPHCHKYVHLLRDTILPHVVLLNEQLKAAEIPVTILPGSEIQVIDANEYRREFEAGVFCHLGDGRDFTLLEFNWAREQFPSDAAALVSWIRAQNVIPILAHPERHEYFWKDPAKLQVLVDAGAWVQVTVDSLLGNHGPSPKVAGEAILRQHPDAILATDAHNMYRCSGMSVGYDWVLEHLGSARSEDLRARAERVLESCRAKDN